MTKRRVKFLIILGLLLSGTVFSYDNLIIHPKLAGVAVEIHNKQANNKISLEQANWIIDGSIAEDTDPRYLNHFYNPKTGQGLSNLNVPAKDWAKSQLSASGDYSVGAILDNYRSDNKKRAYQGIGHILHLVQDMSVPAHVRIDAHPDGDPYESWAEHYGQILNTEIAAIDIQNIDQTFDDLANYTYDNFFSEDTVIIGEINKYKTKKIEINGKNNIYLINEINKQEYKICILDDSSIKIICKVNDDFALNQDYWKMLHPKAVGYSAGVINYFIKQFELIDQEKANNKLGLIGSITNKISQVATNLTKSVGYKWGDIYFPTQIVRENGIDAIGDMFAFSKLWAESGKEVVDSSAQKTIARGQEAINQIIDKARDINGKVLSSYDEVNQVLAQEIEEPIIKTVIKINQPILDNAIKTDEKIGVSYVIDGDTIVLTNGEKVRYIGIDTPELNKEGPDDDECLAWTARLRNMQLLQGDLKLVSDSSADKDKYGRLLRYVYVDGVFVNSKLIQEGLARPFFCESNQTNCPVAKDGVRKEEILKANRDAQTNARGLYSGVCEIKNETSKQTVEILNPNIKNFQPAPEIYFIPHSAQSANIIKQEEIKNDEEVAVIEDEDIKEEIDEEEKQEIENLTIELMETPPFFSNATSSLFTVEVNKQGVKIEYQLNNGDWQLFAMGEEISFSTEGRNKIIFQATDSDEQIASTSYEWIVDLHSPVVNINSLNDKYDSGGFEVSWTGDDIKDANTENSGLKNYDTQYKINNQEWQDWILNTATTTAFFDLPAQAGDAIYFCARANDLAGNIGEWSGEASTSIARQRADHIVISEIQIAGKTATDEFVEIYNPTENKINLKDYRLSRKTQSGKNEYNLLTAFPDINLPSLGYYLVTHPTDYKGATPADAIYSTNSQSIAPDNTVVLYSDAGKTAVDKVGIGQALDFEGQAFANNPSINSSIERKAVSSSTEETMQDDLIHKFLGNGYDSDNNAQDFILQNNPNPQGLNNSTEPKQALTQNLEYLWHFDECSSYTAKDEIKSGILQNNFAWLSGKWGCAGDFPLDKDVNQLIKPLPAQETTISFYLKYQKDYSRLIFTNEKNKKNGLTIYADRINVYYNDYSYSFNYSLDKSWHHFTLVFAKNSLTLYIDGELKFIKKGDYSLKEEMKTMETECPHYRALIDELAIWSRALSREEAVELAQSNLPQNYTQEMVVSPDRRMYYWTFNTGTTTVFDLKQGEDLSVQGLSWIRFSSGKYRLLSKKGDRVNKTFGQLIGEESFTVCVSTGYQDNQRGYGDYFVFRDENNNDLFGAKFLENSVEILSAGNVNKMNYTSLPIFFCLAYDNVRSKVDVYNDYGKIGEFDYSFANQSISDFEFSTQGNNLLLYGIMIWEGAFTNLQVMNKNQEFFSGL